MRRIILGFSPVHPGVLRRGQRSIRGVRRWSGRLSVRKLTIVWRLPGPGAQRCGSFAALPWPCASMLMLGPAYEEMDFGAVIQGWIGESEVTAA